MIFGAKLNRLVSKLSFWGPGGGPGGSLGGASADGSMGGLGGFGDIGGPDFGNFGGNNGMASDRGGQAGGFGGSGGNAGHSTAGPLGGMGTPGGAAEAVANAMGMSPDSVVAQGLMAQGLVNSGKMSAADSIGIDRNAMDAITNVNAVNAANKARGMTMTSIGLVPTSSFTNSTKSNMSPFAMGKMFGSLTTGQNPDMTSLGMHNAIERANLGFVDKTAANFGGLMGGIPGAVKAGATFAGMPVGLSMGLNAMLSAATGSNPFGSGQPDPGVGEKEFNFNGLMQYGPNHIAALPKTEHSRTGMSDLSTFLENQGMTQFAENSILDAMTNNKSTLPETQEPTQTVARETLKNLGVGNDLGTKGFNLNDILDGDYSYQDVLNYLQKVA